MLDSSYEEVGSTIVTGAAIVMTMFLLVAVSATTLLPSTGNTSQVQNPAPVETVVVTAPHAKVL